MKLNIFNLSSKLINIKLIKYMKVIFDYQNKFLK